MPFDMDSFKQEVEVIRFSIFENHITQINWKSSITFVSVMFFRLFFFLFLFLSFSNAHLFFSYILIS